MKDLEKRLTRLEVRSGRAAKAHPVFVVTGMESNEATVALMPGGGTMGRERGESEADFIERVHRHIRDRCSDSRLKTAANRADRSARR